MSTIKDIAKIAGVNVSTVSRALSGSSEVGEETRKRVEQIAKELLYLPNYSARALAGKGTRLIGMIVPEISSNYYAQIVNNVENELNDKGYTLIVGTTGFETKKEVENLEMFIGRKVDGIIFAGMVGSEAGEYLEKLNKKVNIPVVFFEPISKTPKQDSILIDGAFGIKLAVSYLVELGHKSIGFIGEELSSGLDFPPSKKMKDYGIQVDERLVKSG